MSTVWAIVPAVKAAIATGVPDRKHIGLHGHSWGGYQTEFTVTRADIFAAAVAGASLMDMISMHRLIKTPAATRVIFESSQGLFTGGPWDLWDAYTRISPVHTRRLCQPGNQRSGSVLTTALLSLVRYFSNQAIRYSC